MGWLGYSPCYSFVVMLNDSGCLSLTVGGGGRYPGIVDGGDSKWVMKVRSKG